MPLNRAPTTYGIKLFVGILLVIGLTLPHLSDPPAKTVSSDRTELPPCLASFFPRPSTFSLSQTRNRLTQKTIARKIEALNTKRYLSFRDRVQPLLDLIRTMETHADSYGIILVYRQLGEQIAREKTTYRDNDDYHDHLIKTLAQDSEIPPDTLMTMERFYRLYPRAAMVSPQLTWDHYRLLLTIEDHGTRTRYEQEARGLSWTPDQLGAAIREGRQNRTDNPTDTPDRTERSD